MHVPRMPCPAQKARFRPSALAGKGTGSAGLPELQAVGGGQRREVSDVTRTMVPQEGLEPPLPCENQILSLARLPVPPLGLSAYQR